MIFDPTKYLEKYELPNEEGIELGDIDIEASPKYLIDFMQVWVSSIDKHLEKEYYSNGFSEYYKTMFRQRGVTWKEYEIVFKHTIRNFYDYPLLEWLQIDNEFSLERFIAEYQATEDDYARLLLSKEMVATGFFLYRNGSVQLKAVFPYNDLKMHAYVSGATGAGKSTLLNAKIYQLQRDYKKCSIVLIDPHGDLAKNVKRSKLSDERVIYLDYSFKKGHTFRFNPLQVEDKSWENVSKLSAEMAKTIETMLDDTMTTNMSAILAPCIAVLLMRDGSTLSDLQRFFDDSNNADLVELGKRSPFAPHRYLFGNFVKNAQYTPTKRSLNTKLQVLVNQNEFYNITHGESTFDLERAINSNKIVIFNLGDIDGDSRYLLGRLIFSRIFACASKRKRIPKQRRPTTFCFVDEAQEMITPDIPKTLDQARKWGLHLILSNQYPEQLKEMRDSVYANTSIKIFGFNDSPEARRMIHRYIEMDAKKTDNVKEEMKLKKYEFLCKIRGRRYIKFKSTAFFVEGERFLMSRKKEEKLNEFMMQYYREIVKDEEIRDPKSLPISQEREEYDLDEGDLKIS